MSKLIKAMNQNVIFKFISSVRLAVPLMLILGACVAYGTIVESNFNSEYASMLIYKSTWFGFLIIALWLNIFCATISRIPFKVHHIGFVVTHIGLLTLLIGGYITNSSGLDGQLVIPEGQSSSTVVLPHLMVAYQFENSNTPQILKFKKTISELNQSELSEINDRLPPRFFTIKKYLPFAKIEKQFIESQQDESLSNEVALSFILKSNFFNVSEWLNSASNPQMKMGPATLKIIKVEDINKAYVIDKRKTSLVPSLKNRMVSSEVKKTISKSKDSMLILTSITNPKDIKKIKVSDLSKKDIVFNDIKIKLVKQFQRAVVSENKVIEGVDPNQNNPAIELSIEKGQIKNREILYAKFAGFSLNPDGLFGYKFSYEVPEIQPKASSPHGESVAAVEPDNVEVEPNQNNEQNAEVMTAAQAAMTGDNTIIFSVDPMNKGKARITLVKNNAVVMSEILSEGQSVQTPWMGMKIYLGSVRNQAVENIVATQVTPEKAKELPPSALLISIGDETGNEFWLAEGEQKQTQINGKNVVIYFGRQTIDLPFDVKLQKFSKLDYPGTNTPMSFESLVQVGAGGISQLISMNEPMKMQGFTVYQASYSIEPNQTLSIFSVNKDPGRFLKYWGSLILGLGIMIITIMKSSFWRTHLQKYFKGKIQNA